MPRRRPAWAEPAPPVVEQLGALPVVDDGILADPVPHPFRPGVVIAAEFGWAMVLSMIDQDGLATYWAETATHESVDEWPTLMGCVLALQAGHDQHPDRLNDGDPPPVPILWNLI